MVAIIDYGVGNLFSLKSSFESIGAKVVVTDDPSVIEGAERVLLPGVGAFRDAASKLRAQGLDVLLRKLAQNGKPILGICLGMQLLFDTSYEYGEHEGLGLISGKVTPIAGRVPETLKIPHMGWNALHFCEKKHPLFRYLDEGAYVYFVHSYSAVDCEQSIIASTEYGTQLTAAVAQRNVMGCQFHPEKSGSVGLDILRGFCELGGDAL